MIVLGVLAFAVVILTIPIGRAPIWEPNNARWMLLARDMVERGHWLVPEIRGAPNEGLYKPQRFAWAIAVASLPTGHVTELTAVLPSLVSAIIGVAGVFAIGRQLWNVQAGALAALILTTRRWAEAQAHTVSAGWQVLESRTVGGKDVVVIGGSPGGAGRSTLR